MFRFQSFLRVIILVIISGIGLFHAGQAQDTLGLDEAIQLGLQNNYAIQIAHNESAIAENNASLGNAGFLPRLSANISKSRSVEDSRTVYSEGSLPDREDENAESTTTSAGVSLEWTLFDGLRMFTSYERFNELERLGEQQARLTIEQTLQEIIIGYYNITQLKRSLNALENTAEISRERIRIAETKKDLGSGSEYDLLQARADLNADSAALIRQETALKDAKIVFNQLLARDSQTEFTVVENIPLDEQLAYTDLEQQMLTNNVQLTAARMSQEIAELEVKEVKAERYPEISVNAGYNYNKNESGAGFLAFNETNGINYGITASVDIFDGFNINRRIRNAEIALKNQQLALEEQREVIQANLDSDYQNYINALRLVKLESENLTYAERSVSIALERFKLGTISSLELREAQRTLVSAENRLIEAQYEAKVAETNLFRLSGQLTGEGAGE